MRTARDVGCLLIEDMLFEPDSLAGWAEDLSAMGLRTERFVPGTEALYPALQRTYQRVRRDGCISAIVAAGTGCDCALALAGQLPVDRLALIHPLDWQGRGGLAGELNRVRRYARRGEAFCVAEVMIVPGPQTPEWLPERWRGALCHSRVCVTQPLEDVWTIRKEVLKLGIFRFLLDGVTPKYLAENPEMCIIYG